MKDITTTEKDQTYPLFHAYAIRQMVTFILKETKVNLGVIKNKLNNLCWTTQIIHDFPLKLHWTFSTTEIKTGSML